MSSFAESQHTEIRTNWSDDICKLFQARDDYVEEKLGYIPMIRDLIQTHGTNIKVLDYGCGPGKVSRRLIQAKIAKIEAVDTSEDMIHQAIQHSTQGSIAYRKINTGELPYVNDTFDAAICCFVLVNIRSRDEFEKVILEIYRTLKPDGTLYILDMNSKHVGVRFSTLQNGDPGVLYRNGDALPCYLKVPGQEDLQVTGTYWTKDTYEGILNLVGFTRLQIFENRSGHLAESERRGLGINESLYAPFLLFKATKPV